MSFSQIHRAIGFQGSVCESLHNQEEMLVGHPIFCYPKTPCANPMTIVSKAKIKMVGECFLNAGLPDA